MEIEGNWSVHLSETAEMDFQNILRWTAEQFGVRQANCYAEQLISTLTRLTAGPKVPGAKARNDIMGGLYTLHMGGKGRHFILFRPNNTAHKKAFEVLRILHQAMDLPRHLPGSGSEQ